MRPCDNLCGSPGEAQRSPWFRRDWLLPDSHAMHQPDRNAMERILILDSDAQYI
jgi:hypothetical protein